MKIAVTGAFSYSGKYITHRLLERGDEVITLTGHPHRLDPFGGRVRTFPLHFDNQPELVSSLHGAQVLVNTYWVRFDRGENTQPRAVENTRKLIDAAKAAGVERVVHIHVELSGEVPYRPDTRHAIRLPRRPHPRYRLLFPAKFTFRARDPRYDRTVPDDSPLILTGSSAPNIIDPVTGYERRSRSDDLARIAHLINELPGYDVFSISTLADDAPAGQFSLSRYYPSIKNTVKPVRANTPPSRGRHDAAAGIHGGRQ